MNLEHVNESVWSVIWYGVTRWMEDPDAFSDESSCCNEVWLCVDYALEEHTCLLRKWPYYATPCLSNFEDLNGNSSKCTTVDSHAWAILACGESDAPVRNPI